MSQNSKKTDSKSDYIQTIFNNIASHYDIMNRIISWGLDRFWRKKIVDLLAIEPQTEILDLACGTCELTIMLAKKLGNEGQIIGLDFSPEMLEISQKKLEDKNLEKKAKLISGDARRLPFSSNKFDYVGIAFALRNISEREKVLSEMKRVLKPGGTIFILDIFKPTLIGYRQLFLFYFNKVVPLLGKLIFNQYQEYNWLPESLERFMTIKELKNKLESLGLLDVQVEKMMGGGVVLQYGKKKTIKS